MAITDDERRQHLQYAQLAAYLQRAAALAHALGHIEQSRRYYEDSNAAAQQAAPAAHLDQRFERDDECTG